MKTLLIIDAQNDFILPNGTLKVEGALEGVSYLNNFINENVNDINRIILTADWHDINHIAHPNSWVDSEGANVTPYTIITSEDVKNGKYRAKNNINQGSYLQYLIDLESDGKYNLCIWPVHCLAGSQGACIQDDLFKTIVNWELTTGLSKKLYLKGSNNYTEQYSVMKAEVTIPTDHTTSYNVKLHESICEAGEVIIAGWALDYCVAASTMDILNRTNTKDISFKLLKGASQSVFPGGVKEETFLKEFVSKGGIII